MKEEVAKRWITELRSGRHIQATGQLQRGRGMCCLGVLQGVVLGMKTGGCLNLSPDAQEAAGMADRKGFYKEDGRSSSLTLDNDGGMTFSMIADIIERKWPEL